ncbi:MAG: type II toxin-antitoxin system RelE/ParE family toxin [Thiothrix sp.]
MLIIWQKGAIRDLDAVFEFIGMENPPAALAVCELIEKRAGQLAEHPFLGRPGRVEATRELVVAGTPFIVVYRVKSNQVDILAVLHTARRWPEAF